MVKPAQPKNDKNVKIPKLKPLHTLCPNPPNKTSINQLPIHLPTKISKHPQSVKKQFPLIKPSNQSKQSSIPSIQTIL